MPKNIGKNKFDQIVAKTIYNDQKVNLTTESMVALNSVGSVCSTEQDLEKSNNQIESVPEHKLFTYAIVRGDLKMPAGKLAAQVSHATRISLINFILKNPERAQEFSTKNSCGSVVVLSAKNLGQLVSLQQKAIERGLPVALFSDSEHILPPYFNGEPVVTALSIGPAPKDQMADLTKKFRCV